MEYLLITLTLLGPTVVLWREELTAWRERRRLAELNHYRRITHG